MYNQKHGIKLGSRSRQGTGIKGQTRDGDRESKEGRRGAEKTTRSELSAPVGVWRARVRQYNGSRSIEACRRAPNLAHYTKRHGRYMCRFPLIRVCEFRKGLRCRLLRIVLIAQNENTRDDKKRPGFSLPTSRAVFGAAAATAAVAIPCGCSFSSPFLGAPRLCPVPSCPLDPCENHGAKNTTISGDTRYQPL